MQISEATAFLEKAYLVLNEKYFGGELPPVVITIQSSPRAYGHYTTWDAWENETAGYREINIGAETLNLPIEQLMSVHTVCLLIPLSSTMFEIIADLLFLSVMKGKIFEITENRS